MLLIPAIDLRGGNCVRLEQGDFERDTRYSADPLEVARRFEQSGATWLHLVDLDGAREGAPRHLRTLEQIAGATTLKVEFGGGLRTFASVEQAIAAGAVRIVLGTAALESEDLLARVLERYGESIAVGIDARNGLASIRGWVETSTRRAVDLAVDVVSAGVRRIVYTDIATDGMLSGPNIDGLQEIIAAVHVSVVASGGIATEAHLEAASDAGAEAAIVGRALYTGALAMSALQRWR
jgi:phosphoribosylformimino-5-aminoimidazole carboxamide ribotide isomerase